MKTEESTGERYRVGMAYSVEVLTFLGALLGVVPVAINVISHFSQSLQDRREIRRAHEEIEHITAWLNLHDVACRDTTSAEFEGMQALAREKLDASYALLVDSTEADSLVADSPSDSTKVPSASRRKLDARRLWRWLLLRPSGIMGWLFTIAFYGLVGMYSMLLLGASVDPEYGPSLRGLLASIGNETGFHIFALVVFVLPAVYCWIKAVRRQVDRA